MQAFWLSSATRVAASSIVDATIEHGLDEGLRLTAQIRRKLLAVAKRVNPTTEPTRYLSEVRRVLQRFEPELARTISDAALLAWLRGGRSVASFLPEEPEPSFRGLAPPGGPPWGRRAPTGEPWDDHELVLVTEAAKDLARRRVMTAGDYYAAEDAIKRKAFTVARLGTDGAIEKVRDALTEAVQEGKTLRDFRKRMAENLETSSLGEGQTDNIFRTALATAYTNGQEAIRKAPLVRSELPFAETLPILDSRLTEMCRIAAKSGLNGTGIFLADDPEWERTRPSRHWRCRCGIRYLTLEMAADRGITAAKRWLSQGRPPPVTSMYVERVPIELPAGWTR